jgi:hypothetical protein
MFYTLTLHWKAVCREQKEPCVKAIPKAFELFTCLNTFGPFSI